MTRGVAVAVSAITGTPSSLSDARLRYAGRKSCPHWLMQWASSTTAAQTPISASNLRKRLVPSRSGDASTTTASRASSRAARIASQDMPECRATARTCLSRRDWT